MVKATLRNSTSRVTTYGLWPADMQAEHPVLGPGDLLSDPDGEALLLLTETVSEGSEGGHRQTLARSVLEAA